MFTLLRHTVTYTSARAGVAGRRLRGDRGEMSWGQIIAGVLLLVALWVFQDQFADLFHYLVNTLFDALSEGDRGNGPDNQDKPELGDGDSRERSHTPGDTSDREGK